MAVLPLVIAMSFLEAQPAKFPVRLNDVMLNSSLSGNGFGVQRIPTLSVSIGNRLAVSAGPVFDRNFGKMTGACFGFRYFLVNENESYNGHFRLSALVSLQQMNHQQLSENALAREQMAAFDMKNDESAQFCELRYKGWEASAGFACAYHFGFGMILRAEAGVCYFHTIQQTHCEINSFRDESASSLRIGFGIGWSLRHITPKASSAGQVKALQTGE